MTQKAGTTASHERPIRVDVTLPAGIWTDIDVPQLLVRHGFAQSMAEARRILNDQQIVWYDLAFGDPGTTIFDRMDRITERTGLEQNRRFLVEPGMVIAVGKTPDIAACHRIVFVERDRSP